jgi:hypothetical protein
LDALKLLSMASGYGCLTLSEHVDWSEFPGYAQQLLAVIGGRQVSQDDGPDIRLWEVEVRGERLRLVYDDYPQMVSLESGSDAADFLLRSLQTDLTAYVPATRNG